MRFRIPPEHKETVTVIRPSAYENNTEETVASDVVCMIVPRSDLLPRTDLVNVRSGAPIAQTGWVALLEKPNEAIAKADILRRSDATELRVNDVRRLKGSPVMQLDLNEVSIL